MTPNIFVFCTGSAIDLNGLQGIILEYGVSPLGALRFCYYNGSEIKIVFGTEDLARDDMALVIKQWRSASE